MLVLFVGGFVSWFVFLVVVVYDSINFSKWIIGLR